MPEIMAVSKFWWKFEEEGYDGWLNNIKDEISFGVRILKFSNEGGAVIAVKDEENDDGVVGEDDVSMVEEIIFWLLLK